MSADGGAETGVRSGAEVSEARSGSAHSALRSGAEAPPEDGISVILASALGELGRSPLSRKTAMLVALLVDRAVDERAGALVPEAPAGDPLARRRAVAGRFPALATVMDLVAMREDSPVLVLGSVALPDPDGSGGTDGSGASGGGSCSGASGSPGHGSTPVSEADYMVSVYTNGMRPRLLLTWADGRTEDALAVLRAAADCLPDHATPPPSHG